MWVELEENTMNWFYIESKVPWQNWLKLSPQSKFMMCGLEWMWIASITLPLVRKGSLSKIAAFSVINSVIFLFHVQAVAHLVWTHTLLMDYACPVSYTHLTLPTIYSV